VNIKRAAATQLRLTLGSSGRPKGRHLPQTLFVNAVTMTVSNTQIRHRGQYRFWQPIDFRYEYYSWPIEIVAKCHHCGGRLEFKAIIPEHYAKDPVSGGYSVVKQAVTTEIQGRGACPKCAYQASQLSWPTDAYFQTDIAGGSVWAWNEEYLLVLRARVAGDRVLERQLCVQDGLYRYFLTRLPKFVVVKRHRERLLRKLDGFLAKR